MAKYKVEFRGFAYVEAENEIEAEEKFQDDDFAYSEQEVSAVSEVDDFRVRW